MPLAGVRLLPDHDPLRDAVAGLLSRDGPQSGVLDPAPGNRGTHALDERHGDRLRLVDLVLDLLPDVEAGDEGAYEQ